ncbi:zinc finger MYM-type protein 1-like [Gordionus sp. m RMFG-2023]|uniref:zinc finger MYM-type protein 1-like n=1 Tax=Gordionus sp. m RMFG-2023 TaxID=3053472 RepID=UPI0031FD3CC8
MISSKESIQKGDMIPISSIIDKNRVKIAKENRGKIKLTIEAILYCGMQGLALRGHKDSGSLNFNNNDNEGNFRGLLKFKALGDPVLMESLISTNKNATYLSPRIQNEIIDICNNIILEKLIVEINSAPCFSILADETTDIAGIEQMSLCARYVDTHKNIIKEMFLQFIPISSMTGSALADLNINMICGQGYDGARAMSEQFNGLQAFIKKKCPTAINVHCAAHSLNLEISDSCSLPLISNCLGKISSIYEMFRYPKCQNILNRTPCPTRRKKLQKACPTRWSLRHAVTAFIELEEPIINALTEISQWSERDISSEASKEFLFKVKTFPGFISDFTNKRTKFFEEGQSTATKCG